MCEVRDEKYRSENGYDMGPLSFHPFSKTPYRESIKENVHFPSLHTSEPAALITISSVGDRVRPSACWQRVVTFSLGAERSATGYLSAGWKNK